ncbi:MAG: hypothetical protein J7J57_03385 [Caldisericaceae bacterium]|nr:hypothetical protein [Caldisericaceae bacterium]
MTESKVYVELLKENEENKYKLVHRIIQESKTLVRLNPDFTPFYPAVCLQKISQVLLNKTNDDEEK